MTQGDEWEEGLDEEILENLMDLRSYLEKRLKNLEEEAEKMRSLLKIIEDSIVSKSFREAEALQTIKGKREAPAAVSGHVEGIPLKTSQGTLLAEMFVTPDIIRIVLSEGLSFNVNTPPFKSFFISRILEPMRVKDSETVRSGGLLPEMALSYDVIADGDILREVVVRNYGGEKRLREIKSTCRWTLEKMYERLRLS